jgi:RNA polymerase sigma-70 factor, ECF subfamily
VTRWASSDLITGALSGDEAAIERLIVSVWPACFRLAASLIGDRGLAEDAAQETCAIVYRKVATLRSPEAFDAWMYRIVAREAARARRAYAGSSELPYEQGFIADTTANVDVWRALAVLSQPLREVTVLFYFDDLKSEEISRILHIPHATVRTRLARARERLRAQLGNYEFEAQPVRGEVTQHAC